MQYETLTDLLNNEAAAYEYFYALSPVSYTHLTLPTRSTV